MTSVRQRCSKRRTFKGFLLRRIRCQDRPKAKRVRVRGEKTPRTLARFSVYSPRAHGLKVALSESGNCVRRRAFGRDLHELARMPTPARSRPHRSQSAATQPVNVQGRPRPVQPPLDVPRCHAILKSPPPHVLRLQRRGKIARGRRTSKTSRVSLYLMSILRYPLLSRLVPDTRGYYLGRLGRTSLSGGFRAPLQSTASIGVEITNCKRASGVQGSENTLDGLGRPPGWVA